MDVSSLISFLYVTSKPLSSPSMRHRFDRLPEAVVNLILQHFLPSSDERNDPFNRLLRVQLLQSNQARCPGLHAILYLALDVEREIAWKNKIDHTCRMEQQKHANGLLRDFLSNPYGTVTHPYFPSISFNKRPCLTYVIRELNFIINFKLIENYRFNRGDEIIKQLQETAPTSFSFDLKQKRTAVSILSVGVAMSGISYSIFKGIRDFKFPVTLVICAFLFTDLQSNEEELTLLTSIELLFFAASVVAVTLLCLNEFEDMQNKFVPRILGMSRTQHFFFQTKAQLRDIWQIASISVRERVGLAQLLLLARKAPTTEN